jgi:hypothetical protein
MYVCMYICMYVCIYIYEKRKSSETSVLVKRTLNTEQDKLTGT